MPVTVQYDREADALYIRLSDAARERTAEINDTTYVDLGADGQAVGIELLYPSMGVNLEEVGARFHLREHLAEIAAAIARSGAPTGVSTITVGSTRFASSSITMVAAEGTVAAGEAAAAASGVARADQVIYVGT
jgi:uncharacterized protein YuzE